MGLSVGGLSLPAVVETERLVLRPLGPGDAPWIVDGVGDLKVARWLATVPHPYAETDARSFIDGHPAGSGAWAITEDGVPHGLISAREEMGYWLSASSWGRGIATEAARAVAAAWFGAGGGDLRSSHMEGNDASRRVLLKVGFLDAGPKTISSRALGREIPGRAMRLAGAPT